MSAKTRFLGWQKLRELCFERDDYTCVWCGEFEGVTLHLDHLYPVSKGGSNEHENLVTACGRCNLGKHARIIPDAWIPVATCFSCGVRSHPKGRASMFRDGPLWTCAVCEEECRRSEQERDDRWAEDGAWADLEQEQFAWDLLEFADAPEIVGGKWAHVLETAA